MRSALLSVGIFAGAILQAFEALPASFQGLPGPGSGSEAVGLSSDR